MIYLHIYMIQLRYSKTSDNYVIIFKIYIFKLFGLTTEMTPPSSELVSLPICVRLSVAHRARGKKIKRLLTSSLFPTNVKILPEEHRDVLNRVLVSRCPYCWVPVVCVCAQEVVFVVVLWTRALTTAFAGVFMHVNDFKSYLVFKMHISVLMRMLFNPA